MELIKPLAFNNNQGFTGYWKTTILYREGIRTGYSLITIYILGITLFIY